MSTPQDPSPRRGNATVLIVVGLVTVCVVGFSAGFLLNRRMPANVRYQPPAPAPSGPLAATSTRFALSDADRKETLETPSLAAGPAGRVYLAWASQTGPAERTLYLARSTDAGETFGEPQPIAKTTIHEDVSSMRGKQVKRAMRMLPHLAVRNDDIHLGWVEANEDNSAVRYVVAHSTDGGATFGSPQQVHQGEKARSTFTAMTLGPDGTLVCSWIDNRNGVQQPFAAIKRPGSDTFAAEQMVYAGGKGKGICPCCPTSCVVDAQGNVNVAFRNQLDGFRDIYLGHLGKSETDFAEAQPVVTPRWTFDGCPHDGPSLAIADDRLQVAWMDARNDVPRVYFANGSLDGSSFQEEKVDAESTGSQGHPSLAVAADGDVHLVWDASDAVEPPAGHNHGKSEAPIAGSSRRIMYAVKRGNTPIVGQAIAPVAEGFQTRPKVAVADDGKVYVSWGELTTEGKSAVVVRLK